MAWQARRGMAVRGGERRGTARDGVCWPGIAWESGQLRLTRFICTVPKFGRRIPSHEGRVGALPNLNSQRSKLE